MNHLFKMYNTKSCWVDSILYYKSQYYNFFCNFFIEVRKTVNDMCVTKTDVSLSIVDELVQPSTVSGIIIILLFFINFNLQILRKMIIIFYRNWKNCGSFEWW